MTTLTSPQDLTQGLHNDKWQYGILSLNVLIPIRGAMAQWFAYFAMILEIRVQFPATANINAA